MCFNFHVCFGEQEEGETDLLSNQELNFGLPLYEVRNSPLKRLL